VGDVVVGESLEIQTTPGRELGRGWRSRWAWMESPHTIRAGHIEGVSRRIGVC
jgi:hypothetical protein